MVPDRSYDEGLYTFGPLIPTLAHDYLKAGDAVGNPPIILFGDTVSEMNL